VAGTDPGSYSMVLSGLNLQGWTLLASLVCIPPLSYHKSMSIIMKLSWENIRVVRPTPHSGS
jgi:hypothetical protein